MIHETFTFGLEREPKLVVEPKKLVKHQKECLNLLLDVISMLHNKDSGINLIKEVYQLLKEHLDNDKLNKYTEQELVVLFTKYFGFKKYLEHLKVNLRNKNIELVIASLYGIIKVLNSNLFLIKNRKDLRDKINNLLEDHIIPFLKVVLNNSNNPFSFNLLLDKELLCSRLSCFIHTFSRVYEIDEFINVKDYYNFINTYKDYNVGDELTVSYLHNFASKLYASFMVSDYIKIQNIVINNHYHNVDKVKEYITTHETTGDIVIHTRNSFLSKETINNEQCNNVYINLCFYGLKDEYYCEGYRVYAFKATFIDYGNGNTSLRIYGKEFKDKLLECLNTCNSIKIKVLEYDSICRGYADTSTLEKDNYFEDYDMIPKHSILYLFNNIEYNIKYVKSM